MVKGGWQKFMRFLKRNNIWTGQQTFTDINILGGSISGVSALLPMTAVTDPAEDAAVTQAIVDAYSGTIITLTGAGAEQDLAAPTDTTPGKEFKVINNNTSGANVLTVNGMEIEAGLGVNFLWDGDAWGPLGAESFTLLPATDAILGGIIVGPSLYIDESGVLNTGTFQGEWSLT